MAIGDIQFAKVSNAASLTMSPASGEVWKVIWAHAKTINNNASLYMYLTESGTDKEIFNVRGAGSIPSVWMYGNVPQAPGGDATTNNFPALMYTSANWNVSNAQFGSIAGPGIFIDNDTTLTIKASAGNVTAVAQAIIVKV